MSRPLDQNGPLNVLILAPFGRDSRLARDALNHSGLPCRVCADLKKVAREIRAGAGAVLITEEALPAGPTARPEAWIGLEAPWSCLPVIVLLAGRPSPVRLASLRQLERRPNTNFLERPVSQRSLVSTLRTALEARRRQYELRDILEAQVKARRASEEREVRHRLALEGGAMGTWEWDLKTNSHIWDARLYEICGLAPFGDCESAELNRIFFQDLVHPKDEAELRRALDDAIRNATDYRHEFRIVRPDGELRWLAGRGRILRDAQGRPARMIGLNWDITEQKRAEARQAMLSAELNHRVKNLLATVQATVAQTLKSASSMADFSEALSGRLQALARGQDLLIRNEWQASELSSLVQAAIAPLGAEKQISLDGAAIWLKPTAAWSFNLIIHELGTNAVKYGALSVPQGSVRIDYRRCAEQSEFGVFRWIERGGPPTRAPRRRGFGSKLIERCAKNELEGEATLDFTSEGLECVIRFAAEKETANGGPSE